MDLCLVSNDPSQTLLIAADGPRYEISTPETSPVAKTKIVRIEGEVSTGHVGTEVGRVEQHESWGTRLQLCITNLALVLRPFDHAADLEK